MSVRSSPLLGYFCLLGALFGALFFAGSLLQPAPVRTQNAPDQFDASAARERLVRILGDERPHPVDSAANDAVRERLLREIRALGFSPQVQDRFTCRSSLTAPAVNCARVRNIYFDVGAGAPRILASTHYDSVPAGPGASDAGLGIAAWLGAARLFKRDALSARILLTDGEEAGLLGAEAFARDPGMMQRIEAIVNLDARGTRGPALFFETNRPNAGAVRAYEHGAARPLANSIMADVYRLLPNSTDVSVLRREGLSVVNIAVLDGVENYHTPNDSLVRFDGRSLQHMGDSALGAVRALAFGGATDTKVSLTYTDIASRAFIAMPEWTARLALGAALVVLGFFLLERGAIRNWTAFTAPLIGLGVALMLGFAGGAILSAFREGAYWLAHPEISRFWCVSAVLAGMVLAPLRFGRGADAGLIHGAALFWFTLIGLAGSAVLPGLAVLFVPSALVASMGIVAALRWKITLRWSALIAGLVALLIWAPLLQLAEWALGYEYPIAVTALAALALLPWAGLIARLQSPEVARATGAVAFGAAILGIGLAAIAPASSLARPRALSVNYVVDAYDKSAAFSAGAADTTLPAALRNAARFEASVAFPGESLSYWLTPAPYAPVASPNLTLLSDQRDGALRRLSMRLATHGADRVTLVLPSDAIQARVNGQAAHFGKALRSVPARLSCAGRSCDGAEIVITLPDSIRRSQIDIVGQIYGASNAAGALIAKRPKNTVPSQSGDGTISLNRVLF